MNCSLCCLACCNLTAGFWLLCSRALWWWELIPARCIPAGLPWRNSLLIISPPQLTRFCLFLLLMHLPSTLQRWCQLRPEKEGRRLLLYRDAGEGRATSWTYRACCQPHCGLHSPCHPAGSSQTRSPHSGTGYSFRVSPAQQCPQPVCPKFFLAHPGWPRIPGRQCPSMHRQQHLLKSCDSESQDGPFHILGNSDVPNRKMENCIAIDYGM